MFIHKYVCNVCHNVVTVQDEELYANPLHGKLSTHGDVANGKVNPGWNWIPHNVTGAKANCAGALVYRGVEIRDDPAPAPPPPPPTAADVSAVYAHQPGDKNTICGAVDITNTAIIRKGVNAHGKARATLHLCLQAILNNVDALEAWGIDNCAEIDAVDRLFTAGVAAANIRVHSRDQYGSSKPPCENCQGWLVGAEGAHDRRVFKLR